MSDTAGDLSGFQATFERIAANVEQTIQGKGEVIRLTLVALLAEGHILLEDVPGVGKTMLAKSLARSLDCTWSRIQFTPDLLPTDVTGVNVWDRRSGSSRSSPARCLQTSASRTRSTGPHPRRKARCSSAWRSARSRSTA